MSRDLIVLLLAIYCSCGTALLNSSGRKSNAFCPPFPHASLPNGQISSMGSQKFSFSCDPGYLLTSSPVVRCWKGQWTSTKKPTCNRAEGLCEDPEPVEGGRILGDDRGVGSTVQYQCNPGYVLIGQPSRSCLRSGHWSGVEPACMDEKEPVKKVAERLKSKFVTEMASHSSNTSVVPEGRLLDPDSVMHGLELVILLDRSSSLDPADFRMGVNFVKFLLQEFGVRNGNNTSGTRAAVLAFGSKVDVLFNLDNTTVTGPEAASRALDTLKAGGGGTAMMEALIDVSTKLDEPRPLAKKAIFMITDGEPNIGSVEDTIQFAKQLRDRADFEIFTVGIGRGINRHVLSKLASEPLLNHVFVLDKYSDLREVMETIKEKPVKTKTISPFRCGFVKNARYYLKLWPWLAAVYVGLPDASGAPRIGFCSGTLVCSEWVLTAASCFHEVRQINGAEREVQENTKEVFVVLGEKDVINEDRNQMNFYATNVVVHPDFQPLDDLRHNLALVKLNAPAPMRRFRPACMPPSDRTVLLHQDLSVNVSIAGWGVAAETAEHAISGATVRMTSLNRTAVLEEENVCDDVSGGSLARDGVFCAGGIGACIGDTGSPLIAVDPSSGLHHLIGVLSRKASCTQRINQYVDLSRYTQWINRVTEQCSARHLVT